MGASSTDISVRAPGSGFTAIGFATGLIAGVAIYVIGEFWLDEVRNPQSALAALAAVSTWAVAFLASARSGRFVQAAGFAAAIAAIIAAPSFWVLWVLEIGEDIHLLPALFWALAGAPLSAFLLTAFAKSTIDRGAPPPYSAVFLNGLTLPLVAAGALLLFGAAMTLIFVFVSFMRSADVEIFHGLAQEPWVLFPLAGGIAGAAIASMRGQHSVLGALRFILLLLARAATPILAVLSAALLVAVAASGFSAAPGPSPTAAFLLIAFSIALAINGLFQNGEAPPPKLWLRAPVWLLLVVYPVFAGAAVVAVMMRIDQYGLTPPRVIAAAVSALAAAYAVVCVAGALSELNWRNKKWMPLFGPANMMMAGLWAITLIALASPIADPWSISARSQTARVLDGRAATAAFDFGYLKFQLGRHGERALDRLAAVSNHAEVEAIHEGVALAKSSASYWDYEQRAEAARAASPRTDRGPLDLEFNPPDQPNERDSNE